MFSFWYLEQTVCLELLKPSRIESDLENGNFVVKMAEQE
jgi:hypothetical protein